MEEECKEMVEKDLAFVNIEIRPTDVTVYTRTISYTFSDKISGLGKHINLNNWFHLKVFVVQVELLDFLLEWVW